MPNEIAQTFAHPDVRAAATAPSALLDRISLRDFIQEVEIGAFQSERNVIQRLRFNVVLEVGVHDATLTDDVDQTLSYDTLTQAITIELNQERLNLLETLAERIAGRVLAHPTAQRVFVRIEKLDRIPGALGVEIMRSQSTVIPSDQSILLHDTSPLRFIFLPNSVLQSDSLKTWLDVITAPRQHPAVLCLDPLNTSLPETHILDADKRIMLLSIEQNAWALAAKDKRCQVISSRTELEWAAQNKKLSVWAPLKIVLDTPNTLNWDGKGALDLAEKFAQMRKADELIVLKGAHDIPNRTFLRVVKTPSEL